jgi:drug/metabolite transporter (DMT)-like permease
VIGALMLAGAMAFAIEMLAGGLVLLILSMLRGETIPATISNTAIAAWLYLVIFGSLIAFSGYMYLLRTVPPTLATSYAYINPIVAVILGVLIANESLSGWTVAAMALIIFSVLMLSFSAKFERWLRGKPQVAPVDA